MYILSLDSTAIAATVALCDDQKLLSLTTVENGSSSREKSFNAWSISTVEPV